MVVVCSLLALAGVGGTWWFNLRSMQPAFPVLLAWPEVHLRRDRRGVPATTGTRTAAVGGVPA